MLDFSGVLQACDVVRTETGEALNFPSITDTANTGRQIGESQAVTSTSQPTFLRQTLGAFKFTSDAVLVPRELIQDASPINLTDELGRMMGERLGRIQNTKYTTGDGAATAVGILTAAAAGITSASSTSILFDEVIDLEHSIDPTIRGRETCGYMFHDLVLRELRKLKDGEGRYLWQSGANDGAPDLLNNRPYFVNQDMASEIASGNVTMLFGDLQQHKVRQVKGIRLYHLEERYKDTDEVGFMAFVRGDSILLNVANSPIKKLTQI